MRTRVKGVCWFEKEWKFLNSDILAEEEEPWED